MLQIKPFALFFALIAISSNVLAQEITKVNTKQKIECYTLKENYEVLKADPSVKQGNYNGSISFFSEKGKYDQGKKTGTWEFFNGSKLSHKYDFSTGLFLTDAKPKLVESITSLDEKGNPVKELELQNVYLGGDAKMIAVLVQCIRYPGAATEKHITGKVRISATLTKEGKLTGEKTESNLGYGLEEEAMRIFRMYPPDWVPVLVDGKPVDVKVILTIGFSLG
jgi:protein TonB